MNIDLDPKFDDLRRCSTFEDIADWLRARPKLLFENLNYSEELPEDISFPSLEILQYRWVRGGAVSKVSPYWFAWLKLTMPVNLDKYFFAAGRRRSPYHFLRGTGLLNYNEYLFGLESGHCDGYVQWSILENGSHRAAMKLLIPQVAWSNLAVRMILEGDKKTAPRTD